MRGTPASPLNLALEEKAKEEFLNSARRGHEDDGGEGCVGRDLSPPGGAQLFFLFKDLHVCPFVPNFTFTFASESEIWSCTILFCTVSNSM